MPACQDRTEQLPLRVLSVLCAEALSSFDHVLHCSHLKPYNLTHRTQLWSHSWQLLHTPYIVLSYSSVSSNNSSSIPLRPFH
jgi:hypothetical protein